MGAFNEEDSHLLQSLATQAVIAIQEVRLLDALQEVAERLLTQPRQEVLTHLVSLACDLLNAAASAIWILEDGMSWCCRRQCSGYRARASALPLHGSLTGQAVLCNAPVAADDVRTDPRFQPPRPGAAQGWARALVVPMLASGDRRASPVGAFSVYSTGAEPGRFAESEWDEKVLTCLAHYAALAVQNAARQEALHAAQEQRAVAETFAAVGDIAANLLHHLNNKVGTIPVRVQGIQDKCRPALLADRLPGDQPGRDRAQRRRGHGSQCARTCRTCIPSTWRRWTWRPACRLPSGDSRPAGRCADRGVWAWTICRRWSPHSAA